MQREYDHSSIEGFLAENAEHILGKLLIHDEFETTDLQKNAWRDEIAILKDQLSALLFLPFTAALLDILDQQFHR